jgi:hypothetical protein
MTDVQDLAGLHQSAQGHVDRRRVHPEFYPDLLRLARAKLNSGQDARLGLPMLPGKSPIWSRWSCGSRSMIWFARRSLSWMSGRISQRIPSVLAVPHSSRCRQNRRLLCPGYDAAKWIAINATVTTRDWQKFEQHAWLEGDQGPWLVSHAGIHPVWLEGAEPGKYREFIDRANLRHYAVCDGGKLQIKSYDALMVAAKAR